ncbi:MAG: leucine-rich repeat domain-containing protein [Desulfobacterales bacterium]|nr:leucine-rich repeat domain-containing protein [Desulfobacterales bacterium]
MKKKNKLLAPFLITIPTVPAILGILGILAIIAGAASCGLHPGWRDGGDAWEPPRAVVARGGAISNFSSLGWVPIDTQKLTAVLARDGDFLFAEIPGEGEKEYIFPYRSSDGPSLLLTKDELGLRLGGELISVDFSKNDEVRQWIWGAGAELAALRMFALPGAPPAAGSPLDSALRKLSESKLDAGWMVDESETLRRVLELFDPASLIILDGANLQAGDLDRIADEPRLTNLWLTVKGEKEMTLPDRFSKVRRLAIANQGPRAPEFFHQEWESLQSLTFRFSKIESLSGIGTLSGLDELRLEHSEELSDLRALSGLPSLKALNLTGCKKVTDLSPLKGLKQLQFLGLPPTVSPAGLEEIVRDHPELRALEIVECEKLKDLSPLRGLPRLENLILINEHPIDYASLGELKSLRFLALHKDVFENPEIMEELRRAAPECLIVQAAPFCMGSGWILLLWLAAPAACLISYRFPGRGRRSARKNA